MALVRIGRAIRGQATGKLVAIKQLDPALSCKAAFVAMFLDEGRLAMRIRHRNVVATLDVLENQGDLFHILEYVPGETLGRFDRHAREHRPPRPLPLAVISAVVCDALRGLDAAHHTRHDEQSLGVVHRDISPQNIIVGVDGVARILDFGVAKSSRRVHWTLDGAVKGKLGYVAPEQLSRRTVTARADLYSLGVVLWELLTGRKLRPGSGPTEMLREALRPVPPPSSFVPGLDAEIDAVVARACALEPLDRFASAAEMESALAAAISPASPREVAALLTSVAGHALAARERLVRATGVQDRGEAEVVTTLPPPPDAAVHQRLLRASTRPFTPQSDLDDAYLALAGFAPSEARLEALQPEPLDMRGLALAVPASELAAAPPSSRRRRSVRSNVFYGPVQVAPPPPRAAEEPRALDLVRAPLSSRDDLAAASVRREAGAAGPSLEDGAMVRSVRREQVALAYDGDAAEAPLPSGFRRVMSTAACVLTLAAAAVLLVGFGGAHPGARAPRSAYAWIGGYLLVIRGLPAHATQDRPLAAGRPRADAPPRW